MREHLKELLPLMLVGVVLLVFQLTRDSGQVLHFLPLRDQTVVAASTTPTAQTAPPAVALARVTPLPSPTSTAGVCTSSRPAFVGGIAGLRTRLGASMGEPRECERSIDDQGDTQQNTTTGLAYYRSQLNVACFTTGWDHWATRDGDLVHWTGDAVDPPADAAPLPH